LAQQPIKRLGIKPPKISDDHAGLLTNENIEMIEAKAKMEGINLTHAFFRHFIG